MKILRLALAGVWHVHTAMYLRSIENTFGEKVEWLYVWDDDREKALHFCSQLGAKYAATLDEILDDPSVDAVLCEAETNKHKAVIIRTAMAGKPVYTDKVLTIKTEDALEIRDVLKKTGVKFAVSHEVIPVAAYQYAKKLVSEGFIGDIISMHFRRAHGFAKSAESDGKGMSFGLPPDWFSKEIAGGGALIDLGIHGVAILAYFCGKPKRVSAFTHNFTGHETEDSATILVEFENGAIGTAHTNMTTSIMENNFEILGTEGIITITGLEGREDFRIHSDKLPVCGNGMIPVDRDVYAASPMNPICKFIAFVMDDENREQFMDGLDIESGITVVRMVEAAYESAKNGSAVEYGSF